MYKSTKRVTFRLPEELVAHADIASEVTHKNRTEILIEALRQYLEEKESDERFREAVVELYLDNHIEFEKLVEIIGGKVPKPSALRNRCSIVAKNSQTKLADL